MSANPLPMFRYGDSQSSLALVSGPLIFDSGEAEQTFLLRCPDRFLVYNALAGMRPMLFAVNRAHRERYRELVAVLQREMETIFTRTGLPVPAALDPFFVPIDLETLSIEDASWFKEEALPAHSGMALNQASPTAARLLRGLERLLRQRNAGLLTDAELKQAQTASQLALRWHDKATYVELVKSAGGDLPVHARTVLLTQEQFEEIGNWQQLCAAVQEHFESLPAAFFLKLSADSGGNVAARITTENCDSAIAALKKQVKQEASCTGCYGDARLASLRREIEQTPSLRGIVWEDHRLLNFLRQQAGRRPKPHILVQESVEGPAGSGLAGLGIACLSDSGALFASGQLYRDSDRRHFAGSWVSETLSSGVLTEDMRRRMKNLCSLFQKQGYHGPLGFDARLNQRNEWVLIYDCNPRLTGVYPAMAIHGFLQRSGMAVASVASFGYRGEWNQHSVAEWFDILDATGTLFTRSSGRGVLPLPNLSREQGCDLAVINCELDELQGLLDRSGLGTYFHLVQ